MEWKVNSEECEMAFSDKLNSNQPQPERFQQLLVEFDWFASRLAGSHPKASSRGRKPPWWEGWLVPVNVCLPLCKSDQIGLGGESAWEPRWMPGQQQLLV